MNAIPALAGFLWLAGSLLARGSDQTALPDETATLLGCQPGEPLAFATIWERPITQAAKPVADPARTVRRVALANAGGNRFLWRIDFLAPYPVDNSSFILYLDADANAATGRAGHGCEFMLHGWAGSAGITAYTSDGKTYPAPAPRVAIAAGSAFVSYDVDLAQRDGASHFRLNVLSETVEPHRGVSGTGYFAAAGPPLNSRPKRLLDSDLTASVGMEQTWGLDRINALAGDPKNVCLSIRTAKLNGFRLDRSEYRADCAVRSSGAGTITATVPAGVAGEFFPAFIFYDSAGGERIALSTNGQRRGVAVATLDDNNQHLFFLTEPVALQAGDTLELRALGGEGAYRTEDLILLRAKPAARAPVSEFREISLTENRLTWISSWSVACTVELEGGQQFTETVPSQNHRIALPDLKPGESARYRITAAARDGKPVATEWRTATRTPFAEPPTAKAGSVTLQVAVPTALATGSQDWPVTSGVPFPRGVLGSAQHVRLQNATGAAVPLQAAVTGRWPDGSVKWLLIDFRHRGGAASYALEFGPEVASPALTAAASAPLPRSDLVLTDATGKEHRAAVGSFQAEETGLLRACDRAAGAIPDAPFGFEARVHRYPGLPWIRVLLTTGHAAAPAEFTTIRSLAWHLPFAQGATQFVRQHTDGPFESSQGPGVRFGGALGSLFVRDFWQNYPKDLSIGPEGSTLWLMPPLRADEYDMAAQNHDLHKLYFWFDPAGAGGSYGGYKLRQGMTKTHEVWLSLDGSTPPHDRPLFAAATPRWYADSGAFGPLSVANPQRPVVADYDKKVAATLDAYLANREHNREYGQLNFGDWWGERIINWGNIEYDTQHAFFLQFARSGDRRFLQAGEEAETHNRDVDTVHDHAKAERVGCVYAHCIGHVGSYLEKSPLSGPNQGTARGGFTVSHTWCEGHMDHYFLTGDRRSLETGLAVADHYGTWRMQNYDFSNCRDSGWHLILTLGVYRATGDPFYLNAARIIVERVLERQTPEPKFNTQGGGWRRMMVPGHCLCEPAHYGNAGFMVGVLLTGLKWYHLETADPRVAESIRLGAHFLIDDLWAADVGGFRYTSCPVSSKGAWSNFLLFDGIGYAYQLSCQAGRPDLDLARHLAAGTDPAIAAMSGMGKSFSQFIRVAPHYLDLLAELREHPPGPAPVPETPGKKE